MDYCLFYQKKYTRFKKLDRSTSKDFMEKVEKNEELISKKRFTAALMIVAKKLKNVNLKKSKGKKLQLFGVGLRDRLNREFYFPSD